MRNLRRNISDSNLFGLYVTNLFFMFWDFFMSYYAVLDGHEELNYVFNVVSPFVGVFGAFTVMMGVGVLVTYWLYGLRFRISRYDAFLILLLVLLARITVILLNYRVIRG